MASTLLLSFGLRRFAPGRILPIRGIDLLLDLRFGLFRLFRLLRLGGRPRCGAGPGLRETAASQEQDGDESQSDSKGP